MCGENFLIIYPSSGPARKVVFTDAKTAKWEYRNECIDLKHDNFSGSISLYINGKFVRAKAFC